MVIPNIEYCYYSFKGSDGSKHHLRCWVTNSLSLEWKLYINDVEVGRYLDLSTNILLPSELDYAFSWENVVTVYNDLILNIPKQP